jgi:hypothetical protein
MMNRPTEDFAESVESAARNGQLRKPDSDVAPTQVDVEAERQKSPRYRPGEEPEPEPTQNS